MNRRGEVSASEHEERTRNLGIYCQSRKELGKGYRVMDLTLCSPNIWKTQETTMGWGGAAEEKEGTGDHPGHSFSHVRTRRHTIPRLPSLWSQRQLGRRGAAGRAAQRGSGPVQNNHAQWRDRTRGVPAARSHWVPEETEVPATPQAAPGPQITNWTPGRLGPSTAG